MKETEHETQESIPPSLDLSFDWAKDVLENQVDDLGIIWVE